MNSISRTNHFSVAALPFVSLVKCWEAIAEAASYPADLAGLRLQLEESSDQASSSCSWTLHSAEDVHLDFSPRKVSKCSSSVAMSPSNSDTMSPSNETNSGGKRKTEDGAPQPRAKRNRYISIAWCVMHLSTRLVQEDRQR
jgi:hypothetical protein